MTLGIYPWIGYESLRLARAFDWLPADVQLVEGRNASDSLAGLRAGTLDAAALTLDEVLLARSQGVPLMAVLVFDISAGADVLVARPEISHLAALAGKRIAVEHSAVGELLLVEALAAAGMIMQDVTLLDIPPNLQLAAWREGRIDAAVTYAPNSKHLEQAGAIRLYDSRKCPDTIFDVLAVRQDRVWGHNTTLHALLDAHFQALKHMRTNRADAMHRIAAWQGGEAQDVQKALAGVALPSRSGNQFLFAAGGKLAQVSQRLNNLMLARGLLPRLDSLKDLFQPHYLGQDGILS
jgi:NitT/TauT family transport system substrate-binding protein